MANRKVKVSWQELTEILQKLELMMPEEEIKEITLKKPRQVLFYFHRK